MRSGHPHSVARARRTDTALDLSLLYLLAANAGRVISRDEIFDAVWGPDFIAESNIVDRHIRSLRAKLQNDFRKPRYIATVPGRGYRFIPTSQATAGTCRTSGRLDEPAEP